MKKSLSYALSSDTALPHGWSWSTIGAIADVVAGNPAPQGDEYFRDGSQPFLRVQDMGRLGNNSHVFKTHDYINNKAIQSLRLFPKGSVLFTKSGASTLLNQRAILGRDMYVVSHIAATIPHEGILSEWLYYWLKTVDFNKLAHATTLPSLPLSKAKDIPIPVAPHDQQKIIVSEIEKQFSRLDEAVVALKRIRTNLKRYKASVLKAAVEGKLTEEWRKKNKDVEPAEKLLKRILAERKKKWEEANPKKKYKEPAAPDTSNLPELPKGWVWASLGWLIDEPKYGTAKKCDYKTKGIGVLRIPNIANGYVDASDLKFASFEVSDRQTYRLKEGDILTIRSNGSVSLVGKCALVIKADEKYLYAGYLIRMRPLSGAVHSKYLMTCFSSLLLRKQIEAKAKSTSGVNNINSGELQSLIVPYCGKEEQKEIMRIVDEKLSCLEYLLSTVDVNLKRAERLRRSILSSAFTGKLRDVSSSHSQPLIDDVNRGKSKSDA